MNSTPPFKNAVLLKGEIIRVVDDPDGRIIRLRNGNENYPVFVHKDIQDPEGVEALSGATVRFYARKDRMRTWVATQEVKKQN